MIKTKIFLLFIYPLVVFASTNANASIPRIVPYQGSIQSSGSPVNGIVAIEFFVCPEPEKKSSCFTETKDVVANNGIFRTTLGSEGNEIPNLIFQNAQNGIYVSLVVNEVTLEGFQRVVSTPFAIRSKDTDVLPVGTMMHYFGNEAPEGWIIANGESIMYPPCSPEVSLCDEKYRNLVEHLNAILPPEEPDEESIAKLPSMQGRFARGLDTTGGINPDGESLSVGMTQEDALQGHSYQVEYGEHDSIEGKWEWSDMRLSNPAEGVMDYSSSSASWSIIKDSNGSTPVATAPVIHEHGEPNYSSETRPTSMFVNWLVKY